MAQFAVASPLSEGDVIAMATAQGSTSVRRSAGSHTSKSTTARGARRASGAASASAADRGATAAGTDRRRRTRASAPTSSAATTAKRTRGARQQPAEGRKTVPLQGASLIRRTAVTVPVVNVRVPLLSPRVPDPDAMASQTRRAAQAVRANLPPMERLLYYGGLGALAAAGTLEWPVAIAVGAGVWVAGRTGQGRTRQAAAAA